MESAIVDAPSGRSAVPSWYWVVAVLAVVWMLFGVTAWVMDLRMDESARAQMSEAQQQLYATRPQWLFVVYAIAIFTGLVGAIGLVVRKAWAIAALLISLVAIVVQFGYTFFGLDAVQLLGAGQALPFPLVILSIGALLLWFSVRAKQRRWIV